MHYKIKHSCAVVRWIGPRGGGAAMSGNLSSDSFQDTYETCRTKGLLFGEQRRTMAKFACLNMLDACDNHYHKHSTYHNGLGNCLIAVL